MSSTELCPHLLANVCVGDSTPSVEKNLSRECLAKVVLCIPIYLGDGHTIHTQLCGVSVLFLSVQSCVFLCDMSFYIQCQVFSKVCLLCLWHCLCGCVHLSVCDSYCHVRKSPFTSLGAQRSETGAVTVFVKTLLQKCSSIKRVDRYPWGRYVSIPQLVLSRLVSVPQSYFRQ